MFDLNDYAVARQLPVEELQSLIFAEQNFNPRGDVFPICVANPLTAFKG